VSILKLPERRKRTATYLLLFIAVVLVAAFFYERGARVRLIPESIPTDLIHLLGYAAASFLRMTAAYAGSFVFAVVFGYLAATSPRRERFMIPLLDILQSVPVLGFFPAAVYFFVRVSGGTRPGVEAAAVFLIFTSQAWNMAFGVYEAITTIPADAKEVVASFGCGRWKTFLRLLFPSAVPKLIYNSILSWAGGWYFLIACEIIAIGPVRYRLPGLGSYLIRVTEEGNLPGAFLGLGLLTAIVVAMDLLLWRPLSVWGQKFRYEFTAEVAEPERGLPRVFAGGAAVAQAVRRTTRPLRHWLHVRRRLLARRLRRWGAGLARAPFLPRALGTARGVLFWVAAAAGLYGGGRALLILLHSLAPPWPAEAGQIPLYLVFSMLRLLAAYALSLAWTVPLALWVSESPKLARVVTPLAEIGASLPATALFPLIVVLVIDTTGGMNLASILLVITGMQWYLLFNLIAGVRNIPGELKEAARGFGLSRWMTWRKLVLPALLPSLITGSITAWGGGWNALIVSEYLVYKERVYSVRGIGSLLDRATYLTGDRQLILLTLVSMTATIVLLNRLVWRRAYALASDRYKIEN
jgi:NitT/TauT family transport system permease protein